MRPDSASWLRNITQIRTNSSTNETSFTAVLSAYGHNHPSTIISSSYRSSIRWKQQYGQACIYDHTTLQPYPTNFGKIGYPELRRPACGGFSQVAHIVGEKRSLRHMRANSITGNTTEICGDTVRTQLTLQEEHLYLR